MKTFRVWKKVVSLFAAMCMCIPLLGSFGVQAAAGTGDLKTNFEITNVAYSNALDEKIYVIESGEVTCTASVLNTSNANQDIVLISAVYNENNNLVDASMDKQTVKYKTNSDFAVTVSVPADGAKIKSFVWSSAELEPYKEVTSLSEKSNKKFDSVDMYYKIPGDTTKTTYTGVVDEQKGTITFNVYYGKVSESTLYNTASFPWPSFHFFGAEDATIRCVGGSYNGTDETAAPRPGERYNGEVFKQCPVYTDPSKIGSNNQIDIRTERPTFTITAEDGSSVTYKVNIQLLLVDDEFNGAVLNADKTITSGVWSWENKGTTTDGGDDEAGVLTEGGNTFIKVAKTKYLTAQEGSLRLPLKDSNDSWIRLYNNFGNKVFVEYDYRFRAEQSKEEQDAGSSTPYCRPRYTYFEALNGQGTFIMQWTTSRNYNLTLTGPDAYTYPGITTGTTNGDRVQSQTKNEIRINTWYNFRSEMDDLALTGVKGTETADYFFDGCKVTEGMSKSTAITGTDGAKLKTMSMSQFGFRTGNGKAATANEARIYELDLDNLRIGLLLD